MLKKLGLKLHHFIGKNPRVLNEIADTKVIGKFNDSITSLTRKKSPKTLTLGDFSGRYARLSVDRSKLQQTHKVTPFNAVPGDKLVSEAEERVFKKIPLKKFDQLNIDLDKYKTYRRENMPGNRNRVTDVAPRLRNLVNVAKSEGLDVTFKKLGFAVGIPERGRFTPLRQTKEPEMWESVLHHHEAQRAGSHNDLRLHDPKTGIVYSFVVQRMPNPGERVLAIRQQDHDPSSMTFTGRIPKGQYGAGTMKKVFKEPIEVTKSQDDKLSFVIHKAGTPERYTLIKPGTFENNNWLLVNHTPTGQRRKIPLDKPKYQEVDPKALDPNNTEEIWAPKLDGAHNLFILREGKPIETFSYRKSRKGDKLIDHTYKTNLYKTLGKLKGETIIRGELVGLKNDKSGPLTSSEIAGMLNAGTLKSRALQQEKGKLHPFIFDVEKYKGVNFKHYPYGQKIELLKEINRLHPELKLVPMAKDWSDKQLMLSDIKAGVYPLTREGVVVYNEGDAVPKKAPFKKNTELRVLGFYPAATGSKYEGKAVGGYIGQESDKAPPVRVGSGLDDQTRVDMYQNPEKYIGNLSTIEYKEKLKSGKFRVPIHKQMRTLW